MPRPFWWGSIVFGLVNIPVKLYIANRARDVALRLVSPAGVPLERRYLCSEEDVPIGDDEIIRGFPVENDYVTLSDEELESVAPAKSREIDLKLFVPADQIAPIHFEKEYLLLPDKGALKAYRLLAEALRALGRSGIATFVLRDKEHLVAISAHQGLLRAETLRFLDELRTPREVGLPEPAKADSRLEKSLRAAIADLAAERPPKNSLRNPYRARLLRLVESKLSAGEDIYAAPESWHDDSGGAEVIDLMQVLKQRLEGKVGKRTVSADKDVRAAGRSAPRLGDQPKAALYEQAKRLRIQGRSKMSKRQLIEEISKRL